MLQLLRLQRQPLDRLAALAQTRPVLHLMSSMESVTIAVPSSTTRTLFQKFNSARAPMALP
jgi:hypothetical protein